MVKISLNFAEELHFTEGAESKWQISISSKTGQLFIYWLIHFLFLTDLRNFPTKFLSILSPDLKIFS